MIRTAVAFTVITLSLALASPVAAAPPADIDATVAGLMKSGGTPGLALGVVEHGHTVLAKGYGVRRLGAEGPVDAETLFQIGSTTKAFTTAALALLVEEGKIGWDDRVVDHLPDFQMYDPWVTREFTIRDLVTHRSGLGLGAGDLTFVPRSTITRAEIVKAMRWLKPQTSFRTAFAYDNLLYVVAGVVVERVSGQSWEDFVRARLLRPMGMTATTTDEPSRFVNADRAQGHARLGPPFRGEGAESVLDEAKGLGPSVAPAGGIMSNADEMCRWIAVQLAHGALPDGKTRLWSEASAREMWSIVTPTTAPPAQGPLAEAAPQFSGYALGWFVQDYRGHRIIWHAGGTLGFLTRVVLIPEADTGFVIFQNSEDGQVLGALQDILLDHYLKLAPIDWAARFQEAHRLSTARAEAAFGKAASPAHPAPPSLPASGYAGDYKDPWYGGMAVRAAGDTLSVAFKRTPGMVAALTPYTGDTFIARWQDPTIEPAYVTFTVTPDGKIERARLKAVSPLADFSFDYQDLDFTPAITDH